MNFHLTPRLLKDWHGAAAAGLLLLVVLVGYFAAVRPVIAKHAFYESHIASTQRLLHNYRQMIGSKPALQAKLRQLQREQAARGYYMKKQPAALAATKLRSRVKAAVESSGAVLVSTRSLPLVKDELFPRVGLSVRMRGDTEALQRVLYELESRPPLLFIDHLQVYSQQIRRRSRKNPRVIIEETRLTASFELYGYMRGSRASG